MDRNNLILKNGIILTAIMLLVTAPFIGTSFVYANDGSRYRDDSLSVFAPGYLNAAKYRARSAICERTYEKNLFDKMVEYTQERVGQRIETSKHQIVQAKPKLQQKQSARLTGNSTQTARVTAILNADPVEIPAYMRDMVQGYLVNQSGVLELSDIKLIRGNYCAVWTASDPDSARYSVKIQMFDSNGDVLLSAPTTIQDEQATSLSIENFTVLADEAIILVWSGRDLNGKDFLMAQAVVANGELMLETPSQIAVDTTLDSARIFDVVTFGEDDSAAVLWTEVTADKARFLKARTFHVADGTISIASTTLTQAGSFANELQEVVKLANGNLAICWEETGLAYDEVFKEEMSVFSIKIQILDSKGGNVLSTPMTLADTADGARLYSITSLPGGDIAIFWSESTRRWKYYGNGSGSYESYNCLKTQILDCNGSALLPSSFELTNGRMPDSGAIYDVTVRADGSVVVIWS